MGLAHVVITSVDRDDLPNGGAEAFAACITEIRRRAPETSVEVLIPDFKGSPTALQIVMDAAPTILNHNLETVDRLYRLARPGGRYPRALELLANARQHGAAPITVCVSGTDRQLRLEVHDASPRSPVRLAQSLSHMTGRRLNLVAACDHGHCPRHGSAARVPLENAV